jgi:thiol-disulfide isomerase/thioredoxin
MSNKFLFPLVAIAILGVSVFFILSSQNKTDDFDTINDSIQPGESDNLPDNPAPPQIDAESNNETEPEQENKATTETPSIPPTPLTDIAPPDIQDITVDFSGTTLAGNSSKIFDFVKSDYDKATASDKLVVLYFYADWCPLCKAEVPHLYNAFNDIKTDDVIGFRVNYNDSFTDDNERDLAREFGVAYQHTKVFVQNGQRVLKAPDTWQKDRYLSEISAFTN